MSLVSPKPEPTVLLVSRPIDPYKPALPPFEKRITDAAAVQRLYDTSMALPGISPFASYNCGSDNGEVYKLTFLNGTTIIKTMELQVSGCEWLLIDTDNLFHPQDVRQPLLGKTDFFALFSRTTGIAV
ncbi:hypothetical protein KDK_56730 [Dictyobacter kobayashii]|uniref:Uncharacterized protein n=1 Tax=Dictyobacter kobayashii TaxID=2014872 RepID=A0A402AS47_9CHLR|nr:hypothetical protein KDK_56730 [Dictyobacter kobayashii]